MRATVLGVLYAVCSGKNLYAGKLMRALARYQLYVVDKVGLGGRWARRDLLEEAATRVTNRDTIQVGKAIVDTGANFWAWQKGVRRLLSGKIDHQSRV